MLRVYIVKTLLSLSGRRRANLRRFCLASFFQSKKELQTSRCRGEGVAGCRL